MKKIFNLLVYLFLALHSSVIFAEIKYEIYNPQEESIFPVSSVILYGKNDAILIDAQFQKNDAQALVQRIKKLNKNLKTVFISHNDPDYYFGLDEIVKNFPNVQVLSTAQTAYLIDSTKDSKLAIWGPQLKENAPTKIISPEAIKQNYLELENQRINIIQNKNDPDKIFLWIPSIKTVLGGVLLFDQMHLWTADSAQKGDLKLWIQRLNEIRSLNALHIIPGHSLAKQIDSTASINFTKKYLDNTLKFKKLSNNSSTLISLLKTQYPYFEKSISNLELSAKVHKNEMEWSTLSSFPAIGEKAIIDVGIATFELNFIDHKNMSFIGTSGAFKGAKDSVNYTAVEIAPNIYMVYWKEPTLGSNVVHIEDFNTGTLYTNISGKDGSFTNLKGTIKINKKVKKNQGKWKGIPSAFPAVGKKAIIDVGIATFELNFVDHKNMSFIGTSGAFKGAKDSVNYTAVEIAPNIYMVYWKEPTLGSNVVHIEDFNTGTLYTNISGKDGSFTNLKGTIKILK